MSAPYEPPQSIEEALWRIGVDPDAEDAERQISRSLAKMRKAIKRARRRHRWMKRCRWLADRALAICFGLQGLGLFLIGLAHIPLR